MFNSTDIFETGWVYSYEWTWRDNGTWLAFLVYQSYASLIQVIRSLEHRRNTIFWIVMNFGMASNILGGLSGLVYLDCLTFNEDPAASCEPQRMVFHVFVILYYQISFSLLYYRKLKIVPDMVVRQGFLDAVILILCTGFLLAGNMSAFFMNEMDSFSFDLYSGIAAILVFLYFDLWFMFKITQLTMEKAQKWVIFQLTVRTGSIKLLYLVGSFSFRTWGGNHYTNTFWNMGYCLVSLAVIETLMSAQFLKLFKSQPDELKESLIPDQLPIQDTKNEGKRAWSDRPASPCDGERGDNNSNTSQGKTFKTDPYLIITRSSD
ncbi:hypothetical protein BDR26DRAFT_1004175 [Obelidium mucronatum]|nr:hypothetical protein BDR26DRAFT_1004175 [Obelidium mucronatum]